MAKIKVGGFREAALRVLRDAREPLRATEIVQIAQKRGLLITSGQTPANTMYNTLIRGASSGCMSDFVKQGRGLFTLSEASQERIKTPPEGS
jgi:hypothetical protein